MGTFNFGDVAAAIGFLGVAHKAYKHLAGSSGSGSSLAGSRNDHLSSADASFGSLQSVHKKMSARPVLVKVRNVKNANQRVAFVKEMIEKFGYDPDVRKITGDLLTGRMDVWGRVRNDRSFHGYRQNKARSTGEPWAVREKDWNGEVRRVHRFIRNMVRYTRDPTGRDTYTSPPRTLAFYNIGDCDCYTILAGAMLKAIGFPMKVRIIHIRGASTWGHIYLMIGMPPTGITHWLPFDASIKQKLGTQAPRAMIQRYRDYMVR